MSNIAYIDSSALIKLLVRQPETASLEADLAQRDGLLMSRLGAVECRRAAARVSTRRVLQAFEQLLEAVYMLDISPAILNRAAEIAQPRVRSLDAIHLATALSIDDPELELITYDDRMADAARANGLRVVQPGS